MGEEGAVEITPETCVRCETCGCEFFTLVKMLTNDTTIRRELRCDNGHTRIDTASLTPAHVL